ncbi:MAG: alpha/beta hydrolase [Planctomycetota bacterium]
MPARSPITTALCCLAVLLTGPAPTAGAQTNRLRTPAHAAATYGPHPRQVLDLWLADRDEPTPLAIYIHGGGFTGGSRRSINPGMLNALLDAGISVAALDYRLLQDARLPAAHEDVVRAVQKLRHNADRLNLDPTRFGGFGGSAGAQLVMYLAYHEDFADPDHPEPFARQSSRLQAVAPSGGQTSMDPAWWVEHVPGYDHPHRSFRQGTDAQTDEQFAEIVADISAIDLISPDDPPTYLTYRMSPNDEVPADARRAQSWKIHHVVFGTALQELAEPMGVEMYLSYPGASTPYDSPAAFLIDKLGGTTP